MNWNFGERSIHPLTLESAETACLIRVTSTGTYTPTKSIPLRWTKTELDEATGYSGQYWGFDVSTDGKTFILGGGDGLTWQLSVTEKEPLAVEIARSGNNIVLSWAASAETVVIESSPTLSPAQFTALNPQPAISTAGDKNTATIPISGGNVFYRLSK